MTPVKEHAPALMQQAADETVTRAVAASTAVWDSWPSPIDLSNVAEVRTAAMKAAIAPLAAQLDAAALELFRFKDERSYVVGFNDGWDFATVSAKVELAVAVEALKPFATYMQSGMDCDDKNKPLPDEHGVGWVYLTQGDFRRAHRTFSGLTEKPIAG